MKLKLIVTFLLFAFTLAGQNFPEFEDQPLWHLESFDYLGLGTADVSVRAPIDSCGRNWYPIEQISSDENATPQKIGYYLREGAKVFYKKKLSCDEKVYLMYDFSLEEGDSAYIGIPRFYYWTFPDLDSVAYKVDKVEYLDYQGYLRKVLHVSFLFGSNDTDLIGYSSTWVEGIGDLYHPFPPAVCLPNSFACEVVFSLSCLKTVEGTLFSREGGQCGLDQSIIYVNQSNAGMAIQDGKSWETAFGTLSSAIAIAEYGDNIWVAQGTYYPTATLDRTQSIELKNGVKLYGGFQGVEDKLSERNWETYLTVFSGNIGDTLSITDNSYHVLHALGTDSSTVLDGFIIRDGYAIHPSSTYAGPLVNGGGLLVDTDAEHNSSSLSISNCRFTQNIARNGGAVYCNGNLTRYAFPQFSNCSFYQNRGEGQGGAILKSGQNPDGLAQRFVDCSFEQNWAKQDGGGVGFLDAGGKYLFQNCIFQQDTAVSGSSGIHFITYLTGIELEVESCHFEMNQGSDGGALNFGYTGFSSPEKKNIVKITDSKFIRNSARVDRGGAIIIVNSDILAEFIIQGSYFEENSSLSRGGALLYESSSFANSKITISSSIFKNNFVRNFPGSGAIGITGTSFNNNFKQSKLLITNSLFENNAGVLTLGSGSNGIAEADIVNCTFYKNGEFPFAKGRSDSFQMDSFYTAINIANSVIWEPGRDFSQLFVNGSPDNQTLFGYSFENNVISDENCDLPGGNIACGQNNIFELDPQFIDPFNGDFRLHPCSPAINRGKNSLITPISENLDLAMQERIQENVVDIGAYEQPSSALLIADLEVTLPSCHDSNDGSVVAIVDNSVMLSYSWNNAAETGQGNAGLTEGIYQFTVTDENNCRGNFIVSIDAPDSIQASYSLIPPDNGTNGAIQLQNITGGTPPYTHHWDTGDMSASIMNLLMGDYTVTINDANECSKVISFKLENVTDVGEDNKLDKLFFAPNPVALGEALSLYYQVSDPDSYQMMMTDVSGKVLRTASFNLSQTGHIDIHDWPLTSGIYFFIISSNATPKYVTRIVVH